MYVAPSSEDMRDWTSGELIDRYFARLSRAADSTLSADLESSSIRRWKNALSSFPAFANRNSSSACCSVMVSIIFDAPSNGSGIFVRAHSRNSHQTERSQRPSR